MLLQEIYKGVCADYCTNGKFFRKGHRISVECRMPTRIGHLKIKYDHNTYPSIPILGKDISCACRCIGHNTWSNSGIARSRGLRPSYSLCKKKIVRIREKLQHHIKRRLIHGICTSEVQELLTG
jgi:hypothetical protein